MSVYASPIDIAKFVAELNRHKCIGLPTETVYGLAADATSGEAVARIFEMKQRPKFNPLISHVSSIEMAKCYGKFNAVAQKLAHAFWPGPLTMVLPALETSNIHPLVTAGLGTVGLRCPKGIASEIIAEFGKPLAAPSANRSGRISPTTAIHVADEFSDTDLMIADYGACDVGIESTIISVLDDRVIVLRPGSITAEMIFDATGVTPQTYSGDDIKAPGMMKSHYAPDAQLLINQTDIPAGATVLAFGSQAATHPFAHAFNLSETADLREAAANLYRGMKELDTIGAAMIYAQPIPMQGLGIAINDRLARAAAPKESATSNA